MEEMEIIIVILEWISGVVEVLEDGQMTTKQVIQELVLYPMEVAEVVVLV
jgi:hypothetical protein